MQKLLPVSKQDLEQFRSADDDFGWPNAPRIVRLLEANAERKALGTGIITVALTIGEGDPSRLRLALSPAAAKQLSRILNGAVKDYLKYVPGTDP